MVDGSEALKGLITIIGSGGLVTIIGAFLAFRSEAHKGRRGEPEGRTVALNLTKDDAPSLDKAAIEALTNAISTGNGLLLKIAAQMELEQEEHKKERERDLDRREMRILAEEEKRSLAKPRVR